MLICRELYWSLCLSVDVDVDVWIRNILNTQKGKQDQTLQKLKRRVSPWVRESVSPWVREGESWISLVTECLVKWDRTPLENSGSFRVTVHLCAFIWIRVPLLFLYMLHYKTCMWHTYYTWHSVKSQELVLRSTLINIINEISELVAAMCGSKLPPYIQFDWNMYTMKVPGEEAHYQSVGYFIHHSQSGNVFFHYSD